MELLKENLRVAMAGSLEKVREGWERAASEALSWWRATPGGDASDTHLLFLMLMSALAERDIAMSSILMKEVKWSQLSSVEEFKTSIKASWNVLPAAILRAVKFLKRLELSRLLSIPREAHLYVLVLLPDAREVQDKLWKGVRKNDGVCIEQAVCSGADLEEVDDGITPLAEAAQAGREAAVSALIRLGAELDRRSGGQMAALHSASAMGHEGVVRQLLAAGATLHVEDSSKSTPLHCASYWGQLNVVRVLVEAGAHLNPKDKAGRTPLANAFKRKHTEVADYLRSVGAHI